MAAQRKHRSLRWWQRQKALWAPHKPATERQAVHWALRALALVIRDPELARVRDVIDALSVALERGELSHKPLERMHTDARKYLREYPSTYGMSDEEVALVAASGRVQRRFTDGEVFDHLLARVEQMKDLVGDDRVTFAHAIGAALQDLGHADADPDEIGNRIARRAAAPQPNAAGGKVDSDDLIRAGLRASLGDDTIDTLFGAHRKRIERKT